MPPDNSRKTLACNGAISVAAGAGLAVVAGAVAVWVVSSTSPQLLSKVPPKARVKKAAVKRVRIRQKEKPATAAAIGHASNGFRRDVGMRGELGSCR